MGGIDDRDKVSIIGIWCWCFFLQSLPLKGLMKFLPNLLSIICGCQTLKRMMNAVHCGVYVHSKKAQRSLSKSMAVDPKKKFISRNFFCLKFDLVCNACRSLAKVWDDDDPAAVVAPLLLRLKKSIRCLAILTVKRFCGFFSNMQQQQLWKSLQICTHTYAYPGNLTSTIWRLLIHIQIAAAYCCFCHWELLREIERKYY